jgi:hypothetical protein
MPMDIDHRRGEILVQKLKIKAPDQKFHVLPNGYDQDMILAVPKTSVKPVSHGLYGFVDR